MSRQEGWQRLVSAVHYPANLPVSGAAPELVESLKRHRVLILAGQTGSGKTTQMPKVCLQAGLGQSGRILLTQPRRLAATRTALRLAEELGVEIGNEVGYRIRFQHKAQSHSVVEVVTDGIPLSGSLAKNPFAGCDVVVVDEVHERSVNIDLLLGLLKRQLELSPHLKVVLMSATLDTERFASFFPDAVTHEVEGRTYPVDVEHRDESGPLVERCCHTLRKMVDQRQGDVLCFLPTERDITEIARKLNLGGSVEVLPLFSRLAQKDQDKVFRKGGGRKVILSTNIAETSLTLPGVKTVVDSGLVRVLRYQPGRGVPLLEVENISRASARQRMGRAGRVAPGLCVRLYPERTFQAMEEFTAPEIQRQDCAQVLLKLISMGECQPESFPFPSRPSGRALRSGMQQLEFLSAIELDEEEGWRLTRLGTEMVRLPLSPRLAHLMIMAKRQGLLQPAGTLAAFMSIQDPRSTPSDQQAKARDAHRQWLEEGSDLMGILRLYETYRKKEEELSGQGLRRWCGDNFLAWRRMREWVQLNRELVEMVGKIEGQKRAHRDDLHKLILGSHLDHLLEYDEKASDGSWFSLNRRSVFPHPSSSTAKKTPRWAVCTAFLSTSRLFALGVCEVEPRWVVDLAPHAIALKRGEPRYDAKTQKVVSEERHHFRTHLVHRISTKDHHPHDPEEATDVFIREALIRGELEWGRLNTSRERIASLAHFDAAKRIRDDSHHEDRIVEAWRSRIGLCSRFSDLKQIEEIELRLEDLLDEGELKTLAEDLPLEVSLGDRSLPIHYRYQPGHPADGPTVMAQFRDLVELDQRSLESAVPLYLTERLRRAHGALPKAFRKEFTLEDFTKAILESWSSEQTLEACLERWMGRHTKLERVMEDWKKHRQSEPWWVPEVEVDGQRHPSVTDLQLHSRELLEKKRYRNWLRQRRKKVEGDLSQLLAALKQHFTYTDVDGVEHPHVTRLQNREGRFFLEACPDAQRAARDTGLALAPWVGSFETAAPELSDHLITRLHPCLLKDPGLIQRATEAALLGVWARVRPSDLDNEAALKRRVLKCEAKYWGRDLERWLLWQRRAFDIMNGLRHRQVETSQEHHWSKWIQRVVQAGNLDFQGLSTVEVVDFEKNLDECERVLAIWGQEDFEDLSRRWRNLRLRSDETGKHPMSALCKDDLDQPLEGFKGRLSREKLLELEERLETTNAQMEQREKRVMDLAAWVREAEADLEDEIHPKSRKRKRECLGNLPALEPWPESWKAMEERLEAIEEAQGRWSNFGGQKKVVLAEEKTVEKDKLTSALLTAWGGKTKQKGKA